MTINPIGENRSAFGLGTVEFRDNVGKTFVAWGTKEGSTAKIHKTFLASVRGVDRDTR